jgi:hypothetical protein
MDQALSTLYEQYARAIEFFNAQVERKYPVGRPRDLFVMKCRSKAEFSQWWAEVSRDSELQARWLERFEDPEGSYARNCDRIRRTLGEIAIRHVAA